MVPTTAWHPAPDFKVLFESTPGLFLVLSPDFRIVAANNAFLAATATRREEVVDRGLFDVLPDDEDAHRLREALEKVLRTRGTEILRVQRYNDRLWRPVSTPVLGPAGEVRYIIHRLEDVTDLVALRA